MIYTCTIRRVRWLLPFKSLKPSATWTQFETLRRAAPLTEMRSSSMRSRAHPLMTITAGMAGERVRAVGYGESRLVRPNAAGPAEQGRADRRVNFAAEFTGSDA